MPKKNIDSEIISVASDADFQRWFMPSFDEQALNVVSQQPQEEEPEPEPPTREEELAAVEVEEVEIEQVQPLTIEEVEAVRQDAYNEGFSAGEKDGFHAGKVKAQQQAREELEPRLHALEHIMQQLFAPIEQQDQQIEQVLLELVEKIAVEVIQRELQLDSSQIAQVLRQSLKLLPTEGEQVRIYLNPQDFELVKKIRERHEENWRILEDENLQPGGCLVESGSTRIDASIESRIRQISKQLLEQQRSSQNDPPAADLIHEYDLQAQPQEQSHEQEQEQEQQEQQEQQIQQQSEQQEQPEQPEQQA